MEERQALSRWNLNFVNSSRNSVILSSPPSVLPKLKKYFNAYFSLSELIYFYDKAIFFNTVSIKAYHKIV